MRTSILLISFLTLTYSYAQTYYNLESNNVRALISDAGNFFENGTISNAAYEVPVGSDSKAIYSMGFWMVGNDLGSNLHSSYSTFNGSLELTAGPISNDYNSAYYTNTFGTSLWSVSKAEVDNHIANYNSGGYVMPSSIEDWPGNGNTSEGVAAELAPYVDVNANGSYDPVNGDYPFIQGDRAVYVILNDENATDIVGNPPLEVEVHVMFYQINSSDAVDNTTFFNVKVINRSTNVYPDFRFGIFADFDLGNYEDDFWGSDSARNYMYVYNGDNNDEDNGGNLGYGTNPPALGIVSLSNDLESALTFTTTTDPSTATEYYYVMQGLETDGSPFQHTDGYDTKFQYSDDPGMPFSEGGVSNPASDRRGLMVLEPTNLQSQQSVCMDYAVVYHRNMSADNVQNAQELDSVVDYIQSYYSSNLQACSTISVGIEDNQDLLTAKVFPNPTSGEFNVSVDRNVKMEIITTGGELIHSENLIAGVNNIELELATGIYFLRLSDEKSMTTHKMIIK